MFQTTVFPRQLNIGGGVVEVIPDDHLVRLEGEERPPSFPPAMPVCVSKEVLAGKPHNKNEPTNGYNKLINTPESSRAELVGDSYLQSRSLNISTLRRRKIENDPFT